MCRGAIHLFVAPEIQSDLFANCRCPWPPLMLNGCGAGANCLFIRIVNCILQEQSWVYFIERKLLLKVQMFCVKEKK